LRTIPGQLVRHPVTITTPSTRVLTINRGP
jgi:hypothetical protein